MYGINKDIHGKNCYIYELCILKIIKIINNKKNNNFTLLTYVIIA